MGPGRPLPGRLHRWPDIHRHHNEQVQKLRGRNGLFAISNPNLIYVGQVLIIPGRDRRPAANAVKGTKAEAGTQATALEAKAVFTIGPAKPAAQPTPGAAARSRDTGKFAVPIDLKTEQSPQAVIRYGPYITPDYTMISEMTGKIVLENMNPERHRNNLELAISGDESVLRNKVKEQYDKAFLELTADMGMKFDMATGMATVKPRIAAKAGLGGYTFKLQADSPTHLTSTIDLKPIEGSFDLAGRKFKYSSKLSVKVDVTLHPTPKGRPIEEFDARLLSSSKTTTVSDSSKGANNVKEELKTVALIGAIVAAVCLLVTIGGAAISRVGQPLEPAMQRFQNVPGLRSPFIYTIDPNDPRFEA